MAAPVDKMTLFEASKVAKSTGARIRREHESDPVIWFRRGKALWYRQENEGAQAVVLASQYSGDDFRQPYWTILGPDDPQPPQPPEPPDRPPNDNGGGGNGGGGGDGPLPPVLPPHPDDPGGSGGGGGGGGVVVDPDFPPLPPDDPDPHDDPDPPSPPQQTIDVLDSQVSCTSDGIAFSITATASPAGAAFSVVFVCGLGHPHFLGQIIGSDNFGPLTLSGIAEPHACCGGSFKISSMTQGGNGPVIKL